MQVVGEGRICRCGRLRGRGGRGGYVGCGSGRGEDLGGNLMVEVRYAMIFACLVERGKGGVCIRVAV